MPKKSLTASSRYSTSSLARPRVVDVALEVVVGGADQGAPVPGQGEDRPPLAGRDDAGGACRSRGRSRSISRWVPRLGLIRGTSSSSITSSGRIRSAKTPVALTTLSASTSIRSPDSASTKATPAARPFVGEHLGHLGAVQHHRAEALGLAEDRSGRGGRRRSGSRRRGRRRWGRAAPARGPAPAARRGRSCGGGRATSRSPRPPPWRSASRDGCGRPGSSPSRRTC